MAEECKICFARKSICFITNFDCCNKKYCDRCLGDYFYKKIQEEALFEDIQIKCPTPECKTMYSDEAICRMKLPNITNILHLFNKKKETAAEKHTLITKKKQSTNKRHPITIQIIEAFEFLVCTVLDERCPSCGKFNIYTNREIHRMCKYCEYEYCRRCFDYFKGYNHAKNVCENRRMILFFYFVFLIISILLKPMSIVSVHKVYDHLSGGAKELGLSLIYVISHTMWSKWFDNLGYACRGYGGKLCVFISFPVLCIYEILINYIWYTYLLYPYLYKLFLTVVVIAELMLNVAIIDLPYHDAKFSRARPFFLLYSFAGPIIGIILLIINFQQNVYKIMVLMIPFCGLSRTLHIPVSRFAQLCFSIARLIIVVVIIFILFKQKSWETMAMSSILILPHAALTIYKLLS